MNLVLLLLFIAGQGFFSGMETGIISVRRPRIEHAAVKGSWAAKILLFFLDRPGAMISTTLLGVNICVVGASLAAKGLAADLGCRTPTALLIWTAGLSILMLSCEIIPKNWFRQSPDVRCSRFAVLLWLTYRVLYLPVRLFESFTGYLERTIRGETPASLKHAVMREDLRLCFRESEKDGCLSSEASSVLDHTVALHGKKLSEIMIPLEKSIAVTNDTTILEAANLCREHGFLNLPVLSQETPGLCIGFFSYYKAIFEIPEDQWSSRNVSDCREKPVTLSPEMNFTDALNEARLSSAPMFAIGTESVTAGILTRSMIVKFLF